MFLKSNFPEVGYILFVQYILSCLFSGLFGSPFYVLLTLIEKNSTGSLHQWSYLLKQRVMRFFMYFALWIQPWIRYQVDLRTYRELIKTYKGGVLFVSNHRSFLDVHILVANILGVQLMARSSLLKVPGLGYFIRHSRHIVAEKGKVESFYEACQLISTELARGHKVLVFPEMTRCPAGYQGVQKFQSTPFQIATQRKIPVIPICVENSDTYWAKGTVKIKIGQKIKVKSLEPCFPEKAPASSVQWSHSIRQEMASSMELR